MTISLEYVAGFFDGEGCVGYYTRSSDRKPFLSVQIINADKTVLERIRERFGGNLNPRPVAKAEHRVTWRLGITGRRGYDMLVAIRPFLIVKAAKVDEVLAALPGIPELAVRERDRCGRGHLFDEANTSMEGNRRRCRTCVREGKRAHRARARGGTA